MNSQSSTGRFLFLSSCPEPWGGSEELWSGAARILARQGHHVLACKTGVDETHPRIIAMVQDGVNVEDYHKYCMSRTRMYINRVLPYRFQFLPWDLRKVILIENLRKTSYDLAIISQGENFDGLNFVDICNEVGIPYVMVSQKASDLNWPSDSIRGVMQKAYSEALCSYFVAEHNLRLTERQLGQKLDRAEVVPNPFLTTVDAALPWPETKDGRFHLACVGRLFLLEKGQDILIRVLSQEKWRSRPVDVSIYGKGIHKGALEDYVRMEKLMHDIHFKGFTSDVTQIWRDHHALILASRAEGTPLVLIEAMLCGRPGIVTNVGGNPEVVVDNECGFVAQGADVAALDEALERAWACRDQWEKMGVEAARHIRTLIPSDPCATFASKLESIWKTSYPA